MRLICCAILILLCGSVAVASSFEQIEAKARTGSPDAQYRAARMLESGDGVARTLAGAIQWYEKAAKQGHSPSMLRLGMLYYNGEVLGGEVKADPPLAWLWFTFASAYGETAAASEADRIASEILPSVLLDLRMRAAASLASGDFVPANTDKAIALYSSIAQSGSPSAAEALGALYLDPDHGHRDLKQATKWYQQAAEAGSLDASLTLGAMYMDGISVPRDLNEAAKWYQRAAEAGSLRASFCLAKIAESGTKPDFTKAFQMYSETARKADAHSMYRLGEMYAAGTGTAPDILMAYAWFTAAGYFDLKDAKAAARELEPKLTQKQIQQGQLQAHNLIASIESK
jgi:uncharacterized protein